MSDRLVRVFLGRIVKPFGVKGEVKLLPSDDFWDSALASHELIIVYDAEAKRSEHRVSMGSYRKHGGTYVLKLDGVDDRSMAEELVGAEIFIPSDRIDVEMPDCVLPFQVTGCNVRTIDGAYVGIVTGMLFTPAHDIYEVTGETGVSLIPVIPEFIVRQDIEIGEIIIKPIPGLLST
jgi:16S rRNA processing protein RimM